MANILLVDDSRTSRRMLRNILESAGHTIIDEATDGEQAIEKYIANRPAITTLDITMPVMDGLQALKGIKEFDSNAMVIMCSAMGQQAMVIEAIQYGAKDFIVKPFQADRVVAAVKKVIG